MADTTGRWQITQPNTAFYGEADSDNGVQLECDARLRLLNFVSLGATSETGSSVTLEVAGKDRFTANAVYNTDGMESGSVAVPLNHSLVADLAAARSPLTARWSAGAVDTLPITPEVARFVEGCRDRAGK